MLTANELSLEQKKEQEFNDLFETVIKMTPFGKFYSLMIGASRLVQKNLKQHIAVGEDGRPYIVYKSKAGKFLGVFSEPMHKRLARELKVKPKNGKERRKKWGHIFANLLGFGELVERKKQNQHYKKVYILTPSEVTKFYAKKMVAKHPEHKEKIVEAIKKDIDKQKIDKFLESKNLNQILQELNK